MTGQETDLTMKDMEKLDAGITELTKLAETLAKLSQEVYDMTVRQAERRQMPRSEQAELHQMIWVDPVSGYDENCGYTSNSPVKTWDRVLGIARPGCFINLLPGVYEPLHLGGLVNEGFSAYDPLTIKSVQAGKAVFSNLVPNTVKWSYYGNSVYRCVDSEYVGAWWGGASKGYFLPFFLSLAAMKARKMHDNMDPLGRWGMCYEKGFNYVQLPGGSDPSEEMPRISASLERPLITLDHVSGVVIDGVTFEGHGATEPVTATENCRDIRVCNCTFDLGFGIEHTGSKISTFNNRMIHEAVVPLKDLSIVGKGFYDHKSLVRVNEEWAYVEDPWKRFGSKL